MSSACVEYLFGVHKKFINKLLLRACAMIYGPIGRALPRSDIHRKKSSLGKKKTFILGAKKKVTGERESYIYSAL